MDNKDCYICGKSRHPACFPAEMIFGCNVCTLCIGIIKEIIQSTTETHVQAHEISNFEELKGLIGEHIEHYAKESSASARKLLHTAIILTIRSDSVPDFEDVHHCSCQIEGVDGDFHCEFYIGCKERDNLDCLKCPIYFAYLNSPENLPEWIVDGVCKKYNIDSKAICNLGYACDGCPYFPNGKEGVE